MKKNKKKIIYYILLSFSLIVLITSTVIFVYEKLNKKNTKEKLETIVQIKKEVDNTRVNNISLVDKYNEYRKSYGNNDIIGSLKIESVGIDTLLVQTTNNTYYLNHLLNKKYDITGSIFVDHNSNIENSKQINIYGHNSDIYDVPFKNLEKFLSKEFFNSSDKKIIIEKENGLKTFEIFSTKIVDKDIEHTKVEFENDTQWQQHLEILRSNSLYDTNVELGESDQILVLQTCLYDTNLGKYLIILGRKV